MFDRIRSGLRALGSAAPHPPPVVAGAAEAAAVKDALAGMWRSVPERYWRVFLASESVEGRAGFEVLEGAGLVRFGARDTVTPCVRVFPFFGAHVATDLLSHRGRDQVFSLMLEQVYLVRQSTARPGDRVLELCVGSGANLIHFAAEASRAVGVDVNERALAFARFNAALNPGAVPLDLRLGSLFDPVDPDERFDVILVNPPFEPVPPSAEHFLHSHGGEDGLDVVRELLPGAAQRLAPEGRLEIVTWTPVGDRGALLGQLLRDAFPAHHVDLQHVDSQPLDRRIEGFRRAAGYAQWRERLMAAGHRTIDLVYACVAPGEPGVTVRTREDEIDACGRVLAAWE